MPTYPHIDRYYTELEDIIQFGGSDNELNIRPAFQNCLSQYCSDHREKLVLIPELASQGGVPDGTVKDTLRMARGYWEAKDTHDDLDAEIQAKLNQGYPRDNILFEDSQTAVLIQDREETMRVDMTDAAQLDRLILRFLNYELPQIEEFRAAQQQFKTDLPTVLENLRQSVEEAEANNAEYQQRAAEFLALCQQSISPAVTEDDVREMLLQHILTQDIFLRVFAEDQFHRENNIARELTTLEETFFTGDVRRQAIDRLRAYYGVIGRAADEIADYSEKQQFLKAIYEDFYKTYNPAAADTLGIVYTPNEIVDFIIRGTDYLLQKHFRRTLADENVQILDPATGTGTFITSLIDYLPTDQLEYKYLNEIHANEVAILPYYIANLNIEYSYREKTGQYLEFPNLCFVDTLDNMDWQQSGSTSGAVTRQSTFNLGGLSVDNWIRIQEQNEKPISVIIGNPPYNDSQTNWNEFNPNREYVEIDRRISETYVKQSGAQKTHQYDMYKRFLRWASDRLDDDGIIAFITNRAYLDTRQDDGFRQLAAEEFSDLYVLDLGSDVRRNPKIAGTTHNVFGIQTGVAIGFFVRVNAKREKCSIHYARREDAELAVDKRAYLSETMLDDIDFQTIVPDQRSNWLNQSDTDIARLMSLANRETKFAKTSDEEQAVFGLFTNAVKSNRDDWVFDFDVGNLRNKALFFADVYNGFLEYSDDSYSRVIKWSRDLRNEYRRGRRIIYSEANRVQSLYRPFIVKQHFADSIMNDVLTKNHEQMFGKNLVESNNVINFCVNGKTFYVLATDRLSDFHLTGDTQCLPLYRYNSDGNQDGNITEWGLRQICEHYGDDRISAEDIFAYTYAALHDPKYREIYAIDLLQEFPRLPLHPNFHEWALLGQELLDLHIGFESVSPWNLNRVEHEKPD
ncbi:MAG: N-6 DNA methylase, partial [Chloroflexi bacterium]|nr:N-6 DNA methylase [Chloroflexota bacterium]